MTTSATNIPASGAWIEGSLDIEGNSVWGGLPTAGRRTNYSCSNWTSNNSSTAGTMVTQSGGFDSYGACDVSRPLACCNGAPKIVFDGFTSAPATFSGRPAMHAQCAAAFSGSHMCHIAEYLRTVSPTPIPAGGAWIEGSLDELGNSIWGGLPAAGRRTNYSCSNWTSYNSNTAGTMVTETGGFDSYGDCSVARPISCCSR